MFEVAIVISYLGFVALFVIYNFMMIFIEEIDNFEVSIIVKIAAIYSEIIAIFLTVFEF